MHFNADFPDHIIIAMEWIDVMRVVETINGAVSVSGSGDSGRNPFEDLLGEIVEPIYDPTFNLKWMIINILCA